MISLGVVIWLKYVVLFFFFSNLEIGLWFYWLKKEEWYLRIVVGYFLFSGLDSWGSYFVERINKIDWEKLNREVKRGWDERWRN